MACNERLDFLRNGFCQEARKYDSAKGFIMATINDIKKEIKNFPIDKISIKSDFEKNELMDAQREIMEGIYKRNSNEPVRLFFNIDTGKISMIDGFHRLVKIQNNNKDTIKSTIEIIGSQSQLIKFYNECRRK